jgi:hypothetical protein
MEPVFAKHPEMIAVMERLVEPERMLAFRVAWVDDSGKQQVWWPRTQDLWCAQGASDVRRRHARIFWWRNRLMRFGVRVRGMGRG